MPEPEKVPWAGAERSYAGWVPNVRSHLSFSVIGASRRAQGYSRPFRERPSRLVAAMERRTSNDYPWPTWVVRRRWPELTQHWLMVGLTRTTRTWVPDGTDPKEAVDRQGMLVGKVHVLPWQDDPAAAAAQKAAVDRIDGLLRQHGRPSDKELDQLLSDLESTVVAGSLNRAELGFALLRTGELRLWYEPEAMPALDLDGTAPEDDLRGLAEQAYFFIKDVVHDHTHHDPSSDQITPLTEIDPVDADPDHEGEVAWRRETLWSLSREVERLNRNGGLVDQRRSLGIIAYAQAFQKGLMGHVRRRGDPAAFEAVAPVYDYDFAHLKDSIRAQIDVASAARAQTVQLTIAFAATLLSALSVVGSLTSAHNGAQPRPGGALVNGIGFAQGRSFIALLAMNPFLTGGGSAVLLLGVLSATLADGEAGLFNRLQRVISQLSRAASISLARDAGRQVLINLALQAAAALLALAASMLCLAVLTATLAL